MNTRLQKIQITNFKAFRKFELDLEGRHLLIYGANGAGKSSLYWALYTFLQSARKRTDAVEKYFDPGNPQNLLNIFEQRETTPRPGEIRLTFREAQSGNEHAFPISKSLHGTDDEPLILKADLASDFITYRFFFGFSHFRNSEKFNIWPLFEKEILPFCVTTGGGRRTPLDLWNRIKTKSPNPWRSPGIAGSRNYTAFHRATEIFATALVGIVDAISVEAQKFYDTHFSVGDSSKVDLKLGLITPPSSSGDRQTDFEFIPPVIEFGVQINGHTINRPQAFLNEAKLTQLALSVRFAASLVNLHDSDVKLLVLDDLLVSLDMSNRMKVVEILLSETFEDYQKIILTHDMGLFREFRRTLGTSHPDWECVRLEGKASDPKVSCQSEKTDTQKAEEYLHGHRLDEAALCLRKACEDTAKRFTDHNEVIPTKEFIGLADALRSARNRVLAGFPSEFYEKVIRNTPDQHRNLLVASTDDDIDGAEGLDPATRGRLKKNRDRLRKLLTEEQVERLRQIKLIDDILACTERVLNPAAHAGSPPLYEKEVEDALDLIRQLESALN
jgi:ABC-type Mn2+/Zn2+ transport system ATPase subunit